MHRRARTSPNVECGTVTTTGPIDSLPHTGQLTRTSGPPHLTSESTAAHYFQMPRGFVLVKSSSGIFRGGTSVDRRAVHRSAPWLPCSSPWPSLHGPSRARMMERLLDGAVSAYGRTVTRHRLRSVSAESFARRHDGERDGRNSDHDRGCGNPEGQTCPQQDRQTNHHGGNRDNADDHPGSNPH